MKIAMRTTEASQFAKQKENAYEQVQFNGFCYKHSFVNNVIGRNRFTLLSRFLILTPKYCIQEFESFNLLKTYYITRT